MFVDACVIISIVTGEDTAPVYDAVLSVSDTAFTSPLAAWEAIMVLARPDHLNCTYTEAEIAVTEWLTERQIALRDPTSPREMLSHAVAVAENTASASGI